MRPSTKAIRPLQHRPSFPRQVWGPNGALILPWRPRDRRALPASRSWWERVLWILGVHTQQQQLLWSEWQIREFELREAQHDAHKRLGQSWIAHNDSRHVWTWGRTITVWFEAPVIARAA